MSVGEELASISNPVLPFTTTANRKGEVNLSIVEMAPRGVETPSDVENIPAAEDSDGSDLEEEMEEERESARIAFDGIDVDRSGTLPVSEFENILEKMGTTYCEESHAKYASMLRGASGLITRDAFANWYGEWVFGEAESDDESNADSERSTSDAPTASNVLDKFLLKEGSWRCVECMVQNSDANAEKCASCENPNPDFKGTPSSSAGFSVASTSTSSGFSFGFPGTSASTAAPPSFNFGFTPPEESDKASVAPATISGGYPCGISSVSNNNDDTSNRH